MSLNTNDLDARNNLAFVKQQLEELKKQQQQQQDKQKDKKDDLKPSPAAQEAKARADEAVKQRQYKEALGIMETSRKQDPTTEYYADYIKRLQEVNGVADTAKP
jgi:hypothetical protein